MLRPRGAPALLAVLLALLPGCAGGKGRVKAGRAADPRPIVRAVKVDGAKALPKDDIVGALAQKPTHPFHFIPILNFYYPAQFLDGMAWEQDQARIANYYALRGFFDARVVGSQIQRSKRSKKDGSPRSVTVIHSVVEGDPSDFRKIDLRLLSAADPAVRASGVPEPERMPREQEELRARLAKELPPLGGKRFSMQALEDAAGRMEEALKARSFARANVDVHVDAFPEEHAVDAVLSVRTGPPAVFGPYRIDGLEKVREISVVEKIAWRSGEPYDSRVVDRTQQAIYDMGMFSMVTVGADPTRPPVLDENGTEVMPLDILLKERKPGEIRAGGGVGWELGRIDVHGTFGMSHQNLFRRLLRGGFDITGGYAYLGPDDQFPIANGKGELRWPDFPVRTLSVFTSGTISLEVERGYRIFAPKFDAGLTWAPARPVKFTVSYGLGYFDLFPNERLEALRAQGAIRAQDTVFADGYLLNTVREDLLLDFRDNALAANKGALGRITVAESWGRAGQIGDGAGDEKYRFIRFSGDLRGYIPLGTKRIVLAARGAGSYILTMPGTPLVPVSEAVFAGGDGTVRGWKTKYLGPRTVEAACERRDCTLPLGGKVGAWASVELRGNLWKGLWLAGFLDVGRVWGGPEAIPSVQGFFRDLQPSVGGGVRYETAVGRIRLDFAAHPRAWTDEVFREPLVEGRKGPKEQPYWNLHFGIGESF
jgi:translocation and assembly module TamA